MRQLFSLRTCRVAPLLMLLSGSLAYGQGGNLVPNSSFETYIRCPPLAILELAPIDNAVSWFSPTSYPAGLFHGCNVDAQSVLYANLYNSPVPPRWTGHTGVSCAYIFAGIEYDGTFYARYASVRLTQPMVAGKQYCLAMYYRNAKPELDADKASTYGLGMCLTKQPLQAAIGEQPIRATPDVVLRTTTSGTKWQLLKSCFTAKGGEEYLTIGVFHDDILRIPGENIKISATQTFYFQGSQLIFDDVSVIAIEEAQLLGPDTSFCANTTLKLRASFACANTYQWSDGSTDSTLSVTKAGRYWVAIQTDCGTLRDTITVTERKNDLNLGPDTTLCAGQTIRLRVSPTSSLIRWEDDTNLPDRTIAQPGTYWAYTEQNGCQKRDEITLTAGYPPQLSLPADTARCTDSPPVQVRAGPATYRYRWSDGSADSVRTLTSAGTYSVIAQNDCGRVSGQVRLAISDCRCEIYWPDAFTPNGDGVNDLFTGYVDCQYRPIQAVDWQVYNRWGELVYQSAALSPGWDGGYRGVAAPAGVYTYKLLVTTGLEGQSWVNDFTGSVQLLR